VNRLGHPWLDGRFAPVDTLSYSERVWSFLAAHTAQGDLDAVKLDWRFLEPVHHPGGIEAILQTHLFAGYPRTINALATVHGVGVEEFNAGEVDPAVWRGNGEQNCRTIYGDAYEPLRARIASLHPDLDRWMVEIGYGRMLSRPGLTLRQRELCVLAVLAGQNVAPQLKSHLLGAMRAGASRAECRAILDQTTAVWGEDAQVEVDRVWGGL
jgi:4-carboxymuconolactone decarboxylase